MFTYDSGYIEIEVYMDIHFALIIMNKFLNQNSNKRRRK